MLPRPRWGDQIEERGAINQRDRLAARKLPRLPGVRSAGNENGPMRPLGNHHPEQLADLPNTHFERPPMLALHQSRFPVLLEHEINAAIGPAATSFAHLESLATECLADQRLELPP
jgi:hypothetical protein